MYKEHADAKQAAAMAKYMRDQFEFFGLSSPLRKATDKEFLSKNGMPELEELPFIIRDAYKRPQREFQYFINEVTRKCIKKLPEEFIATTKFMIVTRSWWDTVDMVAADLVGTLVKRFPALTKTMDEWIKADNIWLQRTAILHQLRFRKQTDEKRLFDYCLRHASQNEFFIRKAIGWALREYSKHDPSAVKKFVENAPISNLSKKEAMKWLERKK